MNIRQRLMPSSKRRGRGLVALVAVITLAAFPQSAFASVSTTPEAPGSRIGGKIQAMVQVGDRTIVGGQFSTVGGKPHLNVAAIRADGKVDPNFNASVDGVVWSLAASEDGTRIFVGGVFANAGGLPRANLAALDAITGEVVASWQADTVGLRPDVLSLAVKGDRLYVAGRYSGIDGTTRKRLVAVGVTDGEIVTAFRPVPSGILKAVAVSPDGTKVYAGGSFVTIGGQSRPLGVAELDAATGASTAFNPQVGGGKVITIGLNPEATRFYFATEDNKLFSYELSASVPMWEIKTSGNTQAIAVSPTEIYIGGHFSQIVTGKIPRMFIASLEPETGAVTPWYPVMTGGSKGVWSILMTPTHLTVGGVFWTINGQTHKYFARFPGTP